MQITLFIDSLASGGAQRQLCELARLLVDSGERVSLVTYHSKPEDFLFLELTRAGVHVDIVHARSRWRRLWQVRAAIASSQPDVVIAYLNSPSIIAELSRLLRADFPLIVSERANPGGAYRQLLSVPRYLCHLNADIVVCNSRSQANAIRRFAPWLAGRLRVIRNCINADKFYPLQHGKARGGSSKELSIIGIGRYESIKDPRLLVHAVRVLSGRGRDPGIRVDWFGDNFFRGGKPTARSKYFFDLQKYIAEHELDSVVKLHGPVAVDASLYHRYAALCLTSRDEACPNVVGEAMACGLPVIATRVGDIPTLVKDQETGMLFDSCSTLGLVRAITQLRKLDADARNAMGRAAFEQALQQFDCSRLLTEYQDAIKWCLG